MSDIPRWALTSGADIPCVGGCTVVQHTLGDIMGRTENSIPYETYNMYISTLMTNEEILIDKLGTPREVVRELGLFRFFTALEMFRSMLQDALSFFVREDISYDEDRMAFVVIRNGEFAGTIDVDNFDELRCDILRAYDSYDSKLDIVPPKFANKRAEEIYNKILEGRKKAAKKKADPSLELPNIIESVATYHPSLNLTNIFDLTVPQIHNQFARLTGKTQLDIVGLRWAAWGKEDFDFSIWYKDVSDNK